MKNKLVLPSVVMITGLYGILVLLLIVMFKIAGWPTSSLALISIIVIIVQFLVAPFFMDLIMKWFYKVNFDVNMPDYLKVYISKVCNDNKMKYPKIGYIMDGAPNAFTYGRTKNDARIVLTKGIFDILSPEEVKAVVSHELGHAVHYDMLLMTTVQIIPLILLYIYEVMANSSSDDDKGATVAVGLFAYLLYVVSEYVILWFSRSREYFADEFAVIATQNPNALASALIKIGYGLAASNSATNNTEGQNDKIKKRKNTRHARISSVSALGIFDTKSSKSLIVSSYDNGMISKENIKKAARWELWNPWAKWYEFNSTHPLISKRIKAICKYSRSYNQEEFIQFDENRPESYVDDFIVELFIKFLPTVVCCGIAFADVFYLGKLPNSEIYIIGSIMLFIITYFPLFIRSHKNKGYTNKKVADLLGEVKVSGVTSVPCIIEGQIIGRGTPGFVLSEDFVIRDETGIIFLDYNQPFALINKLFALLKSGEYINQYAIVKGWYRRSPVPYIEIYSITVNGKEKKCYTYAFTIWSMIILLCLFAVYIASEILR